MHLAPELDRARARAATWTAAVVGLAAGVAAFLSFGAASDGIILGNDVVPYAAGLAAGEPHGLWNPHHLLFHPLAALADAAIGFLAGDATPLARALVAQQVVACLGGAAAAAAVARAAARWHGWILGALYGALFAAAAGNWLYAAVGETYLPATAALAWLFVLAIEQRLGAPARPRLLTALVVLACLLRQDSVIAVPALALLLPGRAWLRMTAVSGAVLLALYAAAWIAAGSELGFVAWLRGLAETGNWGHAPGAREIQVALGVNLLAYAYVSLFELPLGIASAALLCLPLLPPRRVAPAVGRSALACLAFALLRFTFFTWWQPGNMEYHAGTLLPLFLLHALILPEHRKAWLTWRQIAVMGVALYAVAAGNWIKLVAPFRSSVIDARARRAIELAAPDGLVVSLDQLQHYALLRAADALASPVGAWDAGAAAGAPDSPAGHATHARIDETLAAGGTVVLIRDIVLPARLDLPPWPVEPAFLVGLLAERDFLEVKELDPGGASVLGMVVITPADSASHAE